MKYKSISTKKKIELFPSDQYKCKYEGGTPLKWTRFRSKGRFSNEWLSYEFRRPQKIKVVKKFASTNNESKPCTQHNSRSDIGRYMHQCDVCGEWFE